MFVGRKDILEDLESLWRKRTSSLVACRGRRRIGKSTLFHRHERLIVVICGSVSSWIQKNILGSTGFAGRLSRNYVIPEHSLAECVQFWGEARGERKNMLATAKRMLKDGVLA